MKLKVSVVQQACTADLDEKWAATVQGIHDAAAQGAKLILLQELHRNLYFCQTQDVKLFDLAESIPGPTTNTLSEIAKKLQVVIVSSLFEKRATGLYHNTVVVIDQDGSIAGCYRKMHIPEDPGFHEKFYFAVGDLGFVPIATSVGKLGVLVCWDQWYPEAARLMALAGADLLLYPTSIGWGLQDNDPAERIRQRDAWVTIQRAHAVANGIPVLVCNRVGFEGLNEKQGIQFWGTSFIAGPQGEFLAKASEDQPENLFAEIDFERNEAVRRGWPFLRDRRIDAYEGILKRYL